MGEKDADVQKIKELIKIMKENDLVEIEIKHGDDQMALRRAQPQAAGHIITTVPGAIAPAVTGEGPAQIPAQGPAAPAGETLLEIKSPLVGTFYEGPSPDSDAYVETGAHVDTQTVVCIIEAMKVMNEIKAETIGTIAERLVTNGQAVEYGQVLFRVKPD